MGSKARDGLTRTHGAGEATHSLSVPENDFFTTYTISERVYEELCRIAKRPPKLSERSAPEDGWLRGLHRLGILRLEATASEKSSTPAAPSPSAADITEQATKTTPTCLSSYLS